MTSIKSSSQDISPKREEQVLAKAILAGFVCAFVAGGLNPFDVAKIRLQNQIQHRNQYAGLAGSLRRIVKEEGFMGLAKGLEPSMIREITYSSIRIGSYEPVRRILSHDIDDPTNTTPMVKFFSALIVGAVGSAIANPLDLIKTRFQALLPGESLPYSSTLQAFRHISKFDGISGLYRGWAVTCTRASVLNSVQLGSYDSIKHNLLMKKFGFEEGFLLHLCASMVSGVLTTTAANPFDVIKTRYLSDSGGRYRGVWDCVRQTYRSGGVVVFFKGWTPAYWRLGPFTVIAFLLIEEIRTFLGMNNI